MAEIYANSTLTIAASSSSGPHEGLFRVADPNFIGLPVSKSSHIRARRPLDLASGDLPLLRRGWVFQERLLSPRIIHFANHELIWECMELLDCECQGTQDKPSGTALPWPVSKTYCQQKRWRALKHQPVRITEMWTNLIINYYMLALSKPDDIFPAISGIAKSFREATGWEYSAGMWKQTMIYCLTWHTHDRYSQTRCIPWRAPTFSWASIRLNQTPTVGINYPKWKDMDESAIVEEVRCCPKGDDPTGQLESGYIILSSTVIQATIFDTQNRVSVRIRTLPPEGADAAVFFFKADFDLKQADYEVHDGATVFCLKLFDRKFSVDYGVWLVLIKRNSTVWECNGTQGDCEFERIGLMQPFHEDESDPRTFEEASSEQATRLNAMVKII